MSTARFDPPAAAFQDPTVERRSSTEVANVRRSQIVYVPAGSSPRTGLGGSVSFRVFTVLMLVVAATVFQPWKLLRSHSAATANTADVAPAAKIVTVAQPEPAKSAEAVLPATIRPWQSTTLHARVSGYLTSWNKEIGATVKAGEVLATIETPELDQEVAEANASFQESAAATVQARAERQEAEADLKVAEAQLARTRAEAELAVSQLKRREQLLQTHAISEEEYDTFTKQVETRAADVRAAEADLARRQSNLETRAAVIAAREATAQARQANVDRLKELQAFQRIVAPFDGVVTHRSAEVGMLVTAGKESLFTIEDMSRVRVQVNVPQAYAAQTVPGTQATIHVPEAMAKPVVGTITRIAEGVDSSNRTMLAEMELQNGSRRFQPGTYAQVAITMSQDASSWTIPTNTVQMRVEGPHVAVVDDRRQIELRPVTLGRDLGRRVVVVAGIRGGERLVVNPGDDLQPGMAVQTANTANSPSLAMQNAAESAE